MLLSFVTALVNWTQRRDRVCVGQLRTMLWLMCATLMFGCTTDRRGVRIKPVTGYWYTVKAGDDWSGLQARHKFNLEDVSAINGLDTSESLKKGQKVFLFGVGGTDKASPSKVVNKRVPPKPDRGSTARRHLPPQKKKWAYPIRGARLTSTFGKRGNRPHKGVDLAAKMGTPIYATAAGVVIYSGSRQRGYGNLVIIKHTNDYVSVYAHNRRNLVDEGDKVRQGFQIAELGNSGRSTGPHLHFEIRLKGKPLDPLRLIGKKP